MCKGRGTEENGEIKLGRNKTRKLAQEAKIKIAEAAKAAAGGRWRNITESMGRQHADGRGRRREWRPRRLQ